MIFDSHAHMDECNIRKYYDPPEKVIAVMDKAGIDMAVVSTYRNAPEADPNILEYVAEGVAKYPDRLIPFVRLNPRFGKQALEVLDRAIKEFKFKGVKLHPASYNLIPFGDITVEILKKAAEYNVPVLVHCSDEMMCYPLQFEAAMEQSPDTKVILAHMGGFFHIQDALRVCKRNKNAYVDTCEMPYIAAVKMAYEEIGADKILFGTDIPTDNPLLEIEKIKAADLGKEAEEKIFYKNIASLLNMQM